MLSFPESVRSILTKASNPFLAESIGETDFMDFSRRSMMNYFTFAIQHLRFQNGNDFFKNVQDKFALVSLVEIIFLFIFHGLFFRKEQTHEQDKTIPYSDRC